MVKEGDKMKMLVVHLYLSNMGAGAAVNCIGGSGAPYFGPRRQRLTGLERFCLNALLHFFVKILSLGTS